MKPFVLVVIATGTEEAVLTKIVDKEYPERVFISHGCSILEFKSCRVVMSRLRYMGSLQSCTEVSAMIRMFRPAIVISAGICAMLPYATAVNLQRSDRAYRGMLDLLVSQEAIFYEPAKYKPSESDWRPRQYRGIIDTDWLEQQLKPIYEEEIAKIEPDGNFHIGAVLSGEKVVADRDKADSLRGSVLRLLGVDPVGLEMEYSGIAACCEHAGRPHLMIKAGCDYADSFKDSDYQKDASKISLSTCLRWLESLNDEAIKRLAFQANGRRELQNNDTFSQISNILEVCASGLPPRGFPGLEIEADEKEPGDFVTKWEHTIQRHIFTSIHQKYDWICAEEDWKKALREEETQAVWNAEFRDNASQDKTGLIVDPLDGSANFINGRPEVAISIAEVDNNQVVRAFVSLPYRNILVTANRMFLSVNGEPISPASEKPTTLEKATIAMPGDIRKLTSQKKKADEADATMLDIKKVIDLFIAKCDTVRITGALGYDLCTLALGEIDARISTSAKVEDVACGILLIELIGGRITNLAGEEIDLSTHQIGDGLVAASTERLHAQLMQVLSGNAISSKKPIQKKKTKRG